MGAYCHRCKASKDNPKQQYLGISEDGQLALAQQPPRKAAAQVIRDDNNPGPSYLTSIPNELLSKILSLVACTPKKPWEAENYTQTLSLSLVNKSFAQIAQPLLFRTIDITYPHQFVPACIPVQRLHRTLKSNPALGMCCKSVKFHIPSIPSGIFEESDYVIAAELLSFMPNITSFDCHGGFNQPPTWPLLNTAFQSMKHIKSLRLSREDWDLYLTDLSTVVEISDLGSLTLHGISLRRDHPAWIPKPDLERSLNITKLDLFDWGDTQHALRTLLRLPRALTSFRFRKVDFGTSAAKWNLSDFPALLHDHRHSLKSLELGEVEGPRPGTFNFSSFPELETLFLSRWSLTLTPEQAAQALLAPKVRAFVWDFTIMDQHTESWSDFGVPEKEWIIAFGELAAANKSSALRTIEIVFTPDEWAHRPRTKEEVDTWTFPWELMDEAREVLQRKGIDLLYNKGWTRGEMYRLLEKEKEWEEESEGREELGVGIEDDTILELMEGRVDEEDSFE